MSEDDREYYRRRAAEEAIAAKRAADRAAAEAHKMLAERYSALVEGAVLGRPPSNDDSFNGG